jgi:hypothetical protein
VKRIVQKNGRLNVPKPKYYVNPMHTKNIPGKTPLPPDAESLYKNAIPHYNPDTKGVKHWYSKANDGQYYRYSDSNDGTAHFTGIFSEKEIPNAIKIRFGL